MLLQTGIIRRSGAELRLYCPDEPVECSSSIQLRYELCGNFTAVPGISIRASAVFSWKDRSISGTGRLPKYAARGTINIRAARRGKYAGSGPCFRISDLLGFCRYYLPAGRSAGFSVLPEKTGSAPLIKLTAAGGDEISRRLRKKRNEDLIEIRQYFPGDDVRRLNWKTYAHTGELFIRLGEEVPLPESRLFILPYPGMPDLSLTDEVGAGLYLDYFAACISEIISELETAGISVDLVMPSGRIIRTPDESDVVDIWWSDRNPSTVGMQGGSCLMIVSALSENAADWAAAAAVECPVYAVVPVPPKQTVPEEPAPMRRLLFTADTGSEYRLSLKMIRNIETAAGNQCSKLRLVKGVQNASIL